jgi:predicted neuraminidase
MLESVSKDNGMTWTIAKDTAVLNPGTSVEGITLRDGKWLIIHNDLESGRNSLKVALSDDEGATWKWSRHLEHHTSGRYHYPSAVQSADGTIHATYSFFTPPGADGKEGKSIKHAHFNLAWVMEGRP